MLYPLSYGRLVERNGLVYQLFTGLRLFVTSRGL